MMFHKLLDTNHESHLFWWELFDARIFLIIP